jgi:hypothetical protein
VVFCQFGLQFVPDKLKALREIRRVLVRNGRLAINLPGPTPEVFAIIDDALARHIGPDAAGFVRAVFSLHDAGGIRCMLGAAGFREVSISTTVKRLHAGSAADFLWRYVHSTPLAGFVAQASADDRAALERDVVTASERFVDNRELIFEQGVVVATARKQPRIQPCPRDRRPQEVGPPHRYPAGRNPGPMKKAEPFAPTPPIVTPMVVWRLLRSCSRCWIGLDE